MRLLKVGMVSVDGTKLKANASKNRNVRYDRAGELLEQLARVLDAIEPVPDHLKEIAYSARLVANVDAELAHLVYDSRAEAGVAMLRRGSENQARLLSFSNDHVTLEVSLAADGRTILGEIYPAVATEVTLESRDSVTISAAVDDFGRFRLVTESTSFRMRVTGHLLTPWIDRE
jgi:hypothetical protein